MLFQCHSDASLACWALFLLLWTILQESKSLISNIDHSHSEKPENITSVAIWSGPIICLYVKVNEDLLFPLALSLSLIGPWLSKNDFVIKYYKKVDKLWSPRSSKEKVLGKL